MILYFSVYLNARADQWLKVNNILSKIFKWFKLFQTTAQFVAIVVYLLAFLLSQVENGKQKVWLFIWFVVVLVFFFQKLKQK